MHCNHCNIDTTDGNNTCPLCHRLLGDTCEDIVAIADMKISSDYPLHSRAKRLWDIPFSSTYFITAVAIFFICLTINLATDMSTLWSLVVGIIALYGLITLLHTARSDSGIGMKLILQTFSVLAVISTIFTVFALPGLFEYAVPILAIIMLTIHGILHVVLRNTNSALYVSAIGTAAIGAVPIIIVLIFGMNMLIPSIISATLAGLTIIITLAVKRSKIIELFKCVFHS